MNRGTRVAHLEHGQGTVTHLDGDPPCEGYPEGFNNAGSGDEEVWVDWDTPDLPACWAWTEDLEIII